MVPISLPVDEYAGETKPNGSYGWLIIAVVGVMGIIATFSIAYTSFDHVRKTTAIEYQNRVSELVRQIQLKVHVQKSSLHAFRAYLDLSADLTKAEFSNFTKGLQNSEIGTIAYGWAPRKWGIDPKEYAERMHAFDPNLNVSSLEGEGAQELAENKYPVIAIEPENKLSWLNGKDLASLPSLLGPLQDSIDFNEARLSGSLNNPEGTSGRGPVMLLYPYYKTGVKNFLVDQRRQNVVGVVFLLMDMTSILSLAIKTTSIDKLVSEHAIEVQIQNKDSEGGNVSVIQTRDFDDLSANISQSSLNPVLAIEQRFNLVNRPMRIQMLIDMSAFGLSIYSSAIASLAFGLILTIIICSVIYILSNREQRVKALVVERTRELRISEKRFHDMADVSADWFWEMDTDFRFTFISERFEDVTGLQRQLFMHRKRAEAAGIDVYNTDVSWRSHLDDLEHHRDFSDFRYTMPIGNGRKRHLSISGKAIFDKNGTFVGYRGTGRDVSAEERAKIGLKESETRLQRYVEELEISRQYLEENTAEMAELAEQYAIEKERAEASEKSKSEFLASMSHEIRTPMTGVMGFADMLLDSELNDNDRDNVIKIKAATHSLLSIINDILDLSKLEAGRVEIDNLDFNLRFAIAEVLDLVRERARVKNIELKIDYPSDIPDGIYGDPTRVRQILINLVGNAVKFTNSGEVCVTVRLEGDDDLRILRIGVVDTGIGISKENVQRLFSDFSQADSSISRQYEGTGLGLSISKRLVELMGGGIWAESQEGVGSEFTFRIPYHEATSDVSIKTRQIVQQNFSTTRPLNILVAEDNRLNQKIIVATLEKYGHHATVVENGIQVISEVSNDTYDLILMDVRMPEMSGPEATRVIRSRPDDLSRIPIIALTADAMEEHIQSYLKAGMNACETKPIERGKLLMTINEVLNEEIHVPDMSENESDASENLNAVTSEGAEKETDEETESVSNFLNHINSETDAEDRVKKTES